MVDITSSRPIDRGVGKTPEEAVVAAIIIHPDLDFNDEQVEYLADRPNFMTADARRLGEYDFESGTEQKHSPPVVSVDEKTYSEYTTLRLHSLWLSVPHSQGDVPNVDFDVRLTVPDEVYDGEDTPPGSVYYWKAERISTEDIDFERV